MSGQIYWAATCGFLIGVFGRSFLSVPWTVVAALSLVSCIAIMVLLCYGRSRIALAFVFAIAMGVGIVRMQYAIVPIDQTLLQHVGEQVVIEGFVIAEPDQREKSLRVQIDATTIAMFGIKKPIHSGVIATLPIDSKVYYGDFVRLIGELSLPAAFDTGAGRQFNYPLYLRAQGVSYTLDFAQIEKRDSGFGNPFKVLAIRLKQQFLQGLHSSLPGREAAFAGGIMVGDKRSIGERLTKDFQTAGLIHVLVLSGYNITVVINAVGYAVRNTALLNEVRLAPLSLSGCIVALFVLMSGGAPSAARAGIMALVAVVARHTRRPFHPERALMFAACLIVLWNPYSLCFDPGFQLSVLATFGLVSITPLISAKTKWVTEKWSLREIVASSIGTQCAVLPLLLYQNGQLSLYALVANLLTLPIMPLAMLTSLIAGGSGLVSPLLGVILGLPAYGLLAYVILIAQLTSRLPYASIPIPAFDAWLLVAMYLVLFGYVAYQRRKRPA